MVLVILALIWAAVLLPPFLRYRLEGHPVDSVGRFRRHLRVLESTSPAASALATNPVMAGSPSVPVAWLTEARRLRRLRRRQQVAYVLLGAMASTLIIALIPGFGFMVAVHVIADAAFVAYVAMLAKVRHDERVRDTPADAEGPVGGDAALDSTVLASQAL